MPGAPLADPGVRNSAPVLLEWTRSRCGAGNWFLASDSDHAVDVVGGKAGVSGTATTRGGGRSRLGGRFAPVPIGVNLRAQVADLE